ncbi:hypothetical protein MRX96_057712 [Rhipicephalus microplus]
MSHLAEVGASTHPHTVASASRSGFVSDTDSGRGVLLSAAAPVTGSPPSAIVQMDFLLGSGDVARSQDTVSTSWTQKVDSTTPAINDRSLTSGSKRGTSAESLSLSNSSDGAPTCRICFYGDAKQPLLEPCNCRGTIGFVHRECLESWIQRTVDPQCQVCHFHFTVRKQAQPIWCLLSDAEYRCPVFGYLALGALFVLGIAFVFPLAWLYANILWLYFPFVSFRSSYKAYKKWHEESTRLKLVLSSTETSGPVWSNRCFSGALAVVPRTTC